MDLTSLSDHDTDEGVRLLCAQALAPLSEDVAPAALAGPLRSTTVAAVCVHDRFIGTARDALRGSGVRVAAVTAGFPVGLPSLAHRLDEIRAAVASGADEIDVVIDRDQARLGNWRALYDEVTAFRAACGPARLKTILATHDLGSLQTVARAGLVCCMAGADFIKTSTGREAVNATVPVGLSMAAAIRCFADRAGYAVGLKPAGGLREASDALVWIELARRELGPSWLDPTYLRLGASSLLGSIQNALTERLDPR
jgi:deoxyribose-phosphate aldolase